MSSRELVILGTSSQAPTRHRAHVSTVLRWDDQLILFDPGENTQRQAILAGVSTNRLTAVCITHFHGDHCLGLPGVVQRRALHNSVEETALAPLPIFAPADGRVYLDRLLSCSIFHDTSDAKPHDIASEGTVGTIGNLTLSAASLDHRVTTYGYRLDEPPTRKFDKTALQERNISGPDVGKLLSTGQLARGDEVVSVEEVTHLRTGQSMAFIMDTALCDGAGQLADGVDLMVCESTFANEEAELASRYKHLTAGQAGKLATEAGARRLVLTHFSARYPDPTILGDQAGEHHSDVVVAKDLMTIPVPARTPHL